ncbi:MAG TPA: HAD-IA family hydrolase [Candidatus Saccharimonadales bacterium]|nr:HAD-IA family hydrolase [Candidatus Saccharimonadales bacterium]
MAQPNIEAIIFDCFGVLQVDSTHAFYEESVDDYERLKPQLLDINRQRDYGFISQTEFVQAVASLSQLDADFVEANITAKMTRNQPLIDYLDQLKANYKLGMISNIGPGSMERYFAREELDQMFDTVVLSGEETIAKPHPRIYQIAAERLGVPVGACVMIDDAEDNCAGADAAGMKSIHYQTFKQMRRELSRLI